MIVAIDIGNTNTTVGLAEGRNLTGVVKLETASLAVKKLSPPVLRRKLGPPFSRCRQAEAIVICSVVPDLTEKVRKVFETAFAAHVLTVGQDLVVPIINRYRIAHQVGQDRLVNAYAGMKIFGPGLIIVDFGTAITFDILSKRSEYLGGLIAPGLKIAQEALHIKTALLPYVELARPIELIGGDTVSSIRAGLVYGTAALCDGILQRLLRRECRGCKVVATGGDAHLIKHFSTLLSHIEDNLTLKGLVFIHESLKR